MNPLTAHPIADTDAAPIPRLDYNDLPHGAQLTVLPENRGWILNVPPPGFAFFATRLVRSPLMWLMLVYVLMTNGGWRVVHRVWTGSADPFQLPTVATLTIAMGVISAGIGWMGAAWLLGRMETTIEIDGGTITFTRRGPLTNKTIIRSVADIEMVKLRARVLKIVFRKHPGQRFPFRQNIYFPSFSSRKSAYSGTANLIEHARESARLEAADAPV